MTGKVKCTCGWSWNKSDSSKKDMYVCHECGRDNSNNMKDGGWLDSYADGGTMQEHQENYNDYNVSAPEGFEGDGYSNVGRNSSPAWGGQFQSGGSFPGATGFSYARTGSIPSNGKYAKKTMASAQNGKEMQYYQQGLDWQPKTISQNGSYHTGDKVTYGTPEYREAYDRGEVVTEEGEHSPIALPEVTVRGKKKDKNWLEQYASKIVEENKDAGPLGAIIGTPISAITSLPQLMGMKALTGEMERPSEGLNINNTYGAMAVDAIADPANLIGVGELSGLSKLGKEKALAKLLASKESGLLSNAYKVNPWAFKPNDEMLYRGIGEKGMIDAIENAIIRTPKNSRFSERIFTSPKFEIAQNYSRGNNNPMGYVVKKNSDGSFNVPGIKSTDKSYIAEIPKYLSKKAEYADDYEVIFNKPIDTDNVKILKEDWLQGYKEVPKPTSKFNSEIDWSKWNKEIPENSQLMNEYNAIEQTSKANNTWMKNPDGSTFQGTPEQFVQQNSENFKKSFPNPLINKEGNVQINYHGSPTKLEGNLFREHTNAGEIGTGTYTTTDKGYAKAFTSNYTRNIPEEKLDPTLYELYQNSNNSNKSYAEYNKFTDAQINKVKNQTRFLPKFTDKYKAIQKDLSKTLRDKHSEMFDEGLFQLGDYDSFTRGHQTVVPFTNYPKSAIGNNGMFDMTNPNIYKAVVPGAIGLGALGSMEKQKDGGIIKDDRGQWDHPGEITEIGSNDITMEGVPYDVLGISDTGDTKLMKPGKNYKFKGKKVTEYPMAKNGLRQEQKGLQNLDNLLNFTNYNTKQPGGWLDNL